MKKRESCSSQTVGPQSGYVSHHPGEKEACVQASHEPGGASDEISGDDDDVCPGGESVPVLVGREERTKAMLAHVVSF